MDYSGSGNRLQGITPKRRQGLYLVYKQLQNTCQLVDYMQPDGNQPEKIRVIICNENPMSIPNLPATVTVGTIMQTISLPPFTT